MAPKDPIEDRRRAVEEWNRRALDPLRDALLWVWAAEHHAHRLGEFCDEDNAIDACDIPCRKCAEIADMREAAAAEVERLLKEMER